MRKYFAAMVGIMASNLIYDIPRSEMYRTVNGTIAALLLTAVLSAALAGIAYFLTRQMEEHGPMVLIDAAASVIVTAMALRSAGYVPGSELGLMAMEILLIVPTIFVGIFVANFVRFLLRIAGMNLAAAACCLIGDAAHKLGKKEN